MVRLETDLGPIRLPTPLVAASGTVGSVWEVADVADLDAYGALVTKSVSDEPWPGRPPPRLAPSGLGMMNGIGIQNAGIERWKKETAPRLTRIQAAVWGSAVGHSVEEYAKVARGLEESGVRAIEVNLSCPNLESGSMFALDPAASRRVIGAVREATDLPVGAKLSPNASDVVAVAAACQEGGADFVTLTNTIWGAAIDVGSRRPLLSGGVGGYSGPPLKPIALRCVMEVSAALDSLPIVGCGGVAEGTDVVEYLMAGASAVALGTVHFAEPKAGARVLSELEMWCEKQGVDDVTELIGAMIPW